MVADFDPVSGRLTVWSTSQAPHAHRLLYATAAGIPEHKIREAAKALAAVMGTALVRLQCCEGIAAAEALYEWNYPRQLLAIRLAEATGESVRAIDDLITALASSS